MVMLTLLITCFLVNNCHKPNPQLIPVEDARVLEKIEDGNFIVTPAFILWAYELKAERDLLQLELKKCRELLEKRRD